MVDVVGTQDFFFLLSELYLVSSPLLVPWSRKSRAIPRLPLWAMQPVQSLSACTRVHFTFTFYLMFGINILKRGAGFSNIVNVKHISDSGLCNITILISYFSMKAHFKGHSLPYSSTEQVLRSSELQMFLCGIDLMNVSVYCDSQ